MAFGCLMGPLFPLRLHRKAVEVGSSRQRRWIGAELAGNVVWSCRLLVLATRLDAAAPGLAASKVF